MSHPVAEAIRDACVAAALAGYEDALVSGLCREGAWEAAISAVRRLDPSQLGGDEPCPPDLRGTAAPVAGIETATNLLSRHFSAPGSPAAGSGAAATAAIAAGLLAWTAGRSEQRRQGTFQRRAGAIRRRADTIREALATAAARDAECVRELIEAEATTTQRSPRERAAESSLEVAMRCAQTATLASELAPHALRSCRPDVRVALRLAASAGECAIDLFEANLEGLREGTEWMRSARRRAWRVRLLLSRAALDAR
jgi:formiminotetrahydrofolate cyclodeaminase